MRVTSRFSFRPLLSKLQPPYYAQKFSNYSHFHSFRLQSHPHLSLSVLSNRNLKANTKSRRHLIQMASTASSNPSSFPRPYSVLFVCLGNICRSPAAEAVFRHLVKNKGLDSKFLIDSAGTIGFHEGSKADQRMRTAAQKRGIEITSISRPICSSDFEEFDMIIAMDKQNKVDILEAYSTWNKKDPLPVGADKKVKLFCSYCKKHMETEVPDPYYGGSQGFELVMDILEDGCESLLESILLENAN